MARYTNTLTVNVQPEIVFNQIQQYMIGNGFEYIQYDGEWVFKKGKGILTSPTFVKVVFSEQYVRLEAWIKYVLLPGVYVGEFGMDGFVGAAVKGTMKTVVSQIQMIIVQNNNAAQDYTTDSATAMEEMNSINFATATGNTQQSVYSANPVSNTQQSDNTSTNLYDNNLNNQNNPNAVFCSYCGQQLTSDAVFCDKCGVVTGQSTQNMTRKEYVEKYAQSYNKELRTEAVVCYVCAGLNFIVGLLAGSWGIISSILLVTFALGIHLGKSKVCAVLILLLGCYEMIASIAITGRPAAYVWIIAGISALRTFSNIDKSMKYVNQK